MGLPKKITIANLGGGELNELVDRELSRICESIADVNIKAEAVRTLSIQIKIKPDKKRQTAELAYCVKSTVPGPETSKSTAFIAMDKGELALYGMDVRQGELPLGGEEPLVSEIRSVSPPTTSSDAAPAYAPPLTNN